MPEPERDPRELVLRLGRAVEPAGRVLLDDHAPVAGDVPGAGFQERGPGRLVWRVYQVRGQQDHVKSPVQRQILDPRAYRLRVADVGEHLWGLVNGDHRMTQLGQSPGNAPGTGAELEDGCARRRGGGM